MGLFDGCRCSRLNIHGSKQLVYVVQASSETPSWRRCSWPRIAELRPVLHWPPLAFLTCQLQRRASLGPTDTWQPLVSILITNNPQTVPDVSASGLQQGFYRLDRKSAGYG